MRLIDADEQIRILESIKKKAESNGNEVVFSVNNVIKFLNDSTTAYSVDNIVEELEKAKHEIASEDYCRSINDKEKCDGRNCFECCAEYLIEIVKQGGISDDVCEWNQHKGGVGLKAYNISCCDKTLEMPVSTARELKYCPYCSKKIKVVN